MKGRAAASEPSHALGELRFWTHQIFVAKRV